MRDTNVDVNDSASPEPMAFVFSDSNLLISSSVRSPSSSLSDGILDPIFSYAKHQDVTYLAIYKGETQWTEVLSQEDYDEVSKLLVND